MIHIFLSFLCYSPFHIQDCILGFNGKNVNILSFINPILLFLFVPVLHIVSETFWFSSCLFSLASWGDLSVPLGQLISVKWPSPRKLLILNLSNLPKHEKAAIKQICFVLKLSNPGRKTQKNKRGKSLN